MDSKQRAELRALASKEEAIFQIGKGGITPNVVAAIDSALTARELIKITILRNSEEDPKEVLRLLAAQLNAEPVAAIGFKVILYRKKKDK